MKLQPSFAIVCQVCWLVGKICFPCHVRLWRVAVISIPKVTQGKLDLTRILTVKNVFSYCFASVHRLQKLCYFLVCYFLVSMFLINTVINLTCCACCWCLYDFVNFYHYCTICVVKVHFQVNFLELLLFTRHFSAKFKFLKWRSFFGRQSLLACIWLVLPFKPASTTSIAFSIFF